MPFNLAEPLFPYLLSGTILPTYQAEGELGSLG